MLIVLKGTDRSEHPRYFDQLHRLRYKTFVSGRGWSLPSMNGSEIDQYDVDDAVYILDIDEDDTIQGTVRLTPTIKYSLTADYFSHLIENGENPRARDVYEGTRYIVLPSRKDRDSNRAAKARVLGAMTEWCIENGIAFIQTVIDSATLRTFVELNPQVKPMGLTHPYGGGRRVPGGGECMVIRLPMTPDALDCVREYGGLLEGVPITKTTVPESIIPHVSH